MIRRVLAVCVVLLSACVQNESFTERLEGVPLLLGEFQSFASEQEVRAALASRSVQDIDRSSLPPGDKRPPLDSVTLAVVEYQHLGVAGELRLVLFNDRLMSAWFYPVDVEAYLAALKSRDVAVTPATSGDTYRSIGSLRVRSQRDSQGRTSVVWSDKRLEDQNARWIERFA